MNQQIPFLDELKQELLERAPQQTRTPRPVRRWPRLSGAWVAVVVFASTLLVGGLTWILVGSGSSPSPANAPALLDTFTSGDVVYEFGTNTNQQGPDAPCLGVTFDLDSGGRRSTMACPTEESEEFEYAASLEASAWTFIVGYGLEPGETIEIEEAIRVITTEQVNGRRFFLIQFRQPPGPEPFEVPIGQPDGTMRFISTVLDLVEEPLDARQAITEVLAWWSLVIAGDTESARGRSHPDGDFDFGGLIESVTSLGGQVDVYAKQEVFGTDRQPMLCYLLTGSKGQQSGAAVFRQAEGAWLIWEIRPQTVGCIQDSTSTTTASTTEVERPDPFVSDLPVNPGIPLRIVAIRPNNPSIAVVDLEAGVLTEYPPGSHALPTDATDGAVVTPNRDVIIWTNGVARLFTGELGSVIRVLGPTPPRSLEGFSPALRVVPLPDGRRAWLVQPGVTTSSGLEATLVELIDLSTGGQLLANELDADAFPIASTSNGLVLNTEEVVRTDDGFRIGSGSRRVVHLLDDGTVTELGQGRAVAANTDTVAVLVCPTGDADCEPDDTNELVLAKLDSGERLQVSKPVEEVWLRVGGPMIPSDAMPLQTVSPDGSTLLMSLGRSLDVNNTPAESSLIAVDLTDGTTRTLARFNGSTPLATWSADGEWVALIDRVDIDRIDIQLINFANPTQSIVVEDVIPPGHFPLAAG